jgi:hypothetical protein
MTPEQIIYFFSPAKWEQFTRAWVAMMRPQYAQVRRMGGANDRGVDVAGFHTPRMFRGHWDCFQCKRYEEALTKSDAWPEIAKIFEGVLDDAFVLPGQYKFVAPKGCGPTLDRLLANPDGARQSFLDDLKDAAWARSISDLRKAEIADFAAGLDFSFIKAAPIEDILAEFRASPYFAAWFGGGLPERPLVGPLPDIRAEHETRYIVQLLEVYAEKYAGVVATAEDAATAKPTREHFQQQREYFHWAESLRRSARDGVPPGTFEALQDDVEEGVRGTHDRYHPDGFTRLGEVLDKAMSLSLTSNALLDWSRPKDIKGICHQLANEDRLRWCQA